MKQSINGDLPSVCGKCCGKDCRTFLITRLGIVEGDILEKLEADGDLTLRRLMEIMEWEPCAIAMAVGSLLRQGLILTLEAGEDVFLEFKKQKSAS